MIGSAEASKLLSNSFLLRRSTIFYLTPHVSSFRGVVTTTKPRLTRRLLSSSSKPTTPAQPPSSSTATGSVAGTSVGTRRRVLLVDWYSRQLDAHPLLTKAISSGLIAGAGDWICQALQHQQNHHRYSHSQPVEEDFEESPSQAVARLGGWWDPLRTGRFVILGAFLVAPTVHLWYGQLAAWFPGTTAPRVALRVALDQLVFSPVFLVAWLSSLWTLQGDADHVTVDHLQDDLPELLVANWGLWVPAQLINFRFVPLKFQVLYSNVVALLWNVFLSYRTSTSPVPNGNENGTYQRI